MTSVVLPKVLLGICNKMDKALVCISFAWCMIRVQHSMPTMLDRCSFKSSCMVTVVTMLTVISMMRTVMSRVVLSMRRSRMNAATLAVLSRCWMSSSYSTATARRETSVDFAAPTESCSTKRAARSKLLKNVNDPLAKQ